MRTDVWKVNTSGGLFEFHKLTSPAKPENDLFELSLKYIETDYHVVLTREEMVDIMVNISECLSYEQSKRLGVK